MPRPADTPLAFIGGTGPEGTGLALRFAALGHSIIIGSRDRDRAREVAGRLSAQAGHGADVSGAENAQAAAEARVLFLTVPYAAQAPLLPTLKGVIAPGSIVISTVAPLAFQGGKPRPVAVPDGSAAQEAQRFLPDTRVVAAFHHLSAKHLADLPHPLEGDVLACGDDREAKEMVMDLVRELHDLRPVDAGDIAYAGVLESLTAVLIGMNRRYRTESGVRIVGV